jgi:hypothetical protein
VLALWTIIKEEESIFSFLMDLYPFSSHFQRTARLGKAKF